MIAASDSIQLAADLAGPGSIRVCSSGLRPRRTSIPAFRRSGHRVPELLASGKPGLEFERWSAITYAVDLNEQLIWSIRNCVEREAVSLLNEEEGAAHDLAIIIKSVSGEASSRPVPLV